MVYNKNQTVLECYSILEVGINILRYNEKREAKLYHTIV